MTNGYRKERGGKKRERRKVLGARSRNRFCLSSQYEPSVPGPISAPHDSKKTRSRPTTNRLQRWGKERKEKKKGKGRRSKRERLSDEGFVERFTNFWLHTLAALFSVGPERGCGESREGEKKKKNAGRSETKLAEAIRDSAPPSHYYRFGLRSVRMRKRRGKEKKN